VVASFPHNGSGQDSSHRHSRGFIHSRERPLPHFHVAELEPVSQAFSMCRM
jgi:hypothetical protein